MNLTGATITITGGYQDGGRTQLYQYFQDHRRDQHDRGAYTLTLSGSDTAADYTAALESITFSTTSTSPAARTISCSVTDGTAISLTATKTITIQNLLVADTVNSEVWRYLVDSSTSAPGGVSPFGDGIAEPDGLTVAPDGSYYVSTLIDLGVSNGTGAVVHLSSTGAFLGTVPVYDTHEAPSTLAFGPNGNLYIADNGYVDPAPGSTDSVSPSIYQYNPSTGTIVSSATLSLPQYYPGVGGAVYPGGMAFATNGDLLLGNLDDGSITQFHISASTVTTTTLVQQTNPSGTTAGGASNYYFAIASPAAAANDYLCSDDPIMSPGGMVALPNGDILIDDFDAAFSASSQAFHHQVLEYIPASGSTAAHIIQFADVGTDGTTTPQQQPISIALDSDGNVLVGMNPDEGAADGQVVKYNVFTGASMGMVVSSIGIPSGLALLLQVPTVAASPGTTGYTAGAAAKPVDSQFLAATSSDDNVNLSGATVSITGGFQTGDTLSFTNTSQITGSVSTVGGVYTLTLTGSDTAADYTAALESVTFSSSTSSTATRTISFSVTDGTNSSLVATKQVAVSPPAEITAVYVSGGSSWASQYYAYLASNNLGSATLGYALKTGNSQLTVLPWTNITTISVQFNENVNVNASLLTAALTGNSAVTLNGSVQRR